MPDTAITTPGSTLENGTAQPSIANPPAPEGAGQFDFSTISDGRFNSWEDVSGHLSSLESELATNKGRVAELEGTEFKFATPLAKSIHELAEKGASPEELMAFAKVQTLPLDKMSPEQLVMEHMRYENPDLSDEDITFDFGRTFKQKFDEDDDPNGFRSRSQELELKKRATAARKFFEDKRVEVSMPSSVKSAEQAMEARRIVQQGWESGLNVGDEVEVPIAFKDGETEYGFNLKLPVTKEVRSQLLNYALSKGMEPSMENIQKISQQAGITAFLQDPAKNMKAIAMDAYAKGFQAARTATDNPAPPARPNNGQQGGKIQPIEQLRQQLSQLYAKR